jgi:hypothetical protein
MRHQVSQTRRISLQGKFSLQVESQSLGLGRGVAFANVFFFVSRSPLPFSCDHSKQYSWDH